MTHYDRRVNAPRARNTTIFSSHDRNVIHGHVSRVWAEVLTPSEALVVSMIADRTIGWGRETEIVTLRHFTHGIDRKVEPGTRWHGGVGLTKPTIISTLRTLVEDGFLSVRSVGRTKAYRLRLEHMGQDRDPATLRQRALTWVKELQRRWHLREERRVRAARSAPGARPWEVRKRRCPRKEKLLKRVLRWLKVFTLRYEHNPLLRNGAEPNGSFGAQGARAQEVDDMPLSNRRTPRTRGTTTEGHDGDGIPAETPDTSASLPRRRSRPTPRIRHDGGDNIGRDALLRAAEAADIPAQGRPAPEPTPATPERPVRTDTAAILARVEQNRRDRSMRVTKSNMIAVWNTTHGQHYDDRPSFTGPQRGNFTRIVSEPTPSPDFTWLDVVEWYVSDYARAVSFAVPFMLQRAHQREGILSAPPAVNLFVRFRTELARAYQELHHGAGMTEARHDQADRAHDEHEFWRTRGRVVRQGGAAAITPDVQTPSERIERAYQNAENDPRLAQEVERFEAFDRIAQEVRGAGGDQYDARDAQEAHVGDIERTRLEQERDARNARLAEEQSAVDDDIVAHVRSMYPGVTREEALRIHAEMMGGGQ